MKRLTSMFENQIKQIVPNAQNIKIKIERVHDHYSSKINVRLPGVVFHAQKTGKTMWEALNLCYEAIVKQIVKFKMRKRAKRSYKIWRWQDPLGPPA